MRGCGSPRLVAHPELHDLSVAHIDCDAFYAAVEKRDRPHLIDKPLIVGGGQRGVVTTACYIARIRGVRSAMPMFTALKLCPDAVVVRPDMAKYAAVGREVRERMRAVTPLVEPLSIDEAFLDLGGTERLHRQPPALTLARLSAEIERDLGITVSVGLSHNKFLAKIASDLRKPRGFSVIGREETLRFLADKPISMIWGVGEAAMRVLEADRLRTIGQLQEMSEEDLLRRYGSMGQRLYRLSRGIDARSVSPRGEAKSISAETTFNTDLSRKDDLLPILRGLSEKVARKLKETDLAATTIVLKLKTADFKLRTRNRKLANPTRLADRIFETGRQLLEKELDGTRFRLIGIGCSEFDAAHLADPSDLVDPGLAKRAKAEAAFDTLRSKFGAASIETGYTFRPPASARPRSSAAPSAPRRSTRRIAAAGGGASRPEPQTSSTSSTPGAALMALAICGETRKRPGRSISTSRSPSLRMRISETSLSPPGRSWLRTSGNGRASRRKTRSAFCIFSASPSSDWTAEARSEMPSGLSSAETVTITEAPGSSMSRNWMSVSVNRTTSYWPVASDSWRCRSCRRSWSCAPGAR